MVGLYSNWFSLSLLLLSFTYTGKRVKKKGKENLAYALALYAAEVTTHAFMGVLYAAVVLVRLSLKDRIRRVALLLAPSMLPALIPIMGPLRK